MGVVSVFSYGLADLSGLINSTEQLYVAEVLHNVVIEINEEHTEAAASTGYLTNWESLKSHSIDKVSIYIRMES